MVDQWIDFSDYEVDRYASALYIQIFDVVQYNEEKFNFVKKELFNVLKIADHHLRTRTFLITEHITAADLCLSSCLVQAFKFVFVNADCCLTPRRGRVFPISQDGSAKSAAFLLLRSISEGSSYARLHTSTTQLRFDLVIHMQN